MSCISSFLHFLTYLVLSYPISDSLQYKYVAYYGVLHSSRVTEYSSLCLPVTSQSHHQVFATIGLTGRPHSAMILQVTFRNLSDEPIVAQIHPRKRKDTQALLILQPSCRLTTKIAEGELSLHPHSRTLTPTDKDVPNVDRTATSQVSTPSYSHWPTCFISKWKFELYRSFITSYSSASTKSILRE